MSFDGVHIQCTFIVLQSTWNTKESLSIVYQLTYLCEYGVHLHKHKSRLIIVVISKIIGSTILAYNVNTKLENRFLLLAYTVNRKLENRTTILAYTVHRQLENRTTILAYTVNTKLENRTTLLAYTVNRNLENRTTI